MGSDFSIIMAVRHRFGTAPDSLEDGGAQPDSNAPFVGLVGEFPFSCPGIDSSQFAALQFQYRGSEQGLDFPDPVAPSLVGTSPEYPVSINDRELAGGVPAAPRSGELPLWSLRLLVVDPHVLADQNLLRIQATTEAWNGYPAGVPGPNFTIDNVVIFYKTRPGSSRPDRGPVRAAQP
jgi:hypothetical protein